MKIAEKYVIQESLQISSQVSTFRAIDSQSSLKVVLKEIKSAEYSAVSRAQISRIYRQLQDAAIEGVPRIVDLFQEHGNFYVCFADPGGNSLRATMERGPLDLATVLRVASRIALILGRLHERHIVHGNIKPENIILSGRGGGVVLTDIGFPILFAGDPHLIRDPFFVRYTLAYISPEQTGRMNRSVDYRTDFYSLGVTMFEMLSDKPPFSSGDGMELIFSHIAREAGDLRGDALSMNGVVAAIVMKLLSKDPEERYQSAAGLAADLDRCLEQWGSGENIDAFEIASNDVSIQFISSKVLFGREEALSRLLKKIDDLERGQNVIALVSGNPGVGKSALVYGIHKSVVSRGGYFVSGKYDPQRTDMPYSAIMGAFGNLLRQILTENQEKLDVWQSKLSSALGPLGKIAADVLEEVELIIGEQPGVVSLGPEESRNRFILAMKKLVATLSGEQHPLVLFIDDLQWADVESLNLLQNLIEDKEISSLYLIGAYRSSEVDEEHPLRAVIDEIELTQAKLVSIELCPLSRNEVRDLVASFLKSSKEKSRPLSDVIYKKTLGNPLFVNHYLKTMYDTQMLWLDAKAGWQWDEATIDRMEVTSDVVDLLIAKLSRLPEFSQQILRTSACIGVEFELDTLAGVLNVRLDDLLEPVNTLVREGLLICEGSEYRYSHDRIHEAVLSMMSSAERDKLQYLVGRQFLSDSVEGSIQERILDCVNKLNSVTHLIEDENERTELAVLNFAAAKKAKSSVAYRAAFVYCSAGIGLLGEDSLKTHYDLSLSLHTLAAEAAFSLTEYAELEKISSAVLKNAQSLMDTIRIYDLRIQMFTAQNNLGEAIKTGTEVLNALGLKISRSTSLMHLSAGFVRTKLALFRKSFDELRVMPEMRSKKMRACATILNRLSTSAYWSNPELLANLVLTTVRMPLKHGVSPEFSYFYAGYGLFLCSIGDVEAGYKFGELGLALLERFKAFEYAPRTQFIFNCFVRHWKDPLSSTLDALLEGFHISMENGDVEFAGYYLMAYCYSAFWSSTDLRELEQETAAHVRTIAALKQETPLNVMKMDHQRMLNLIGLSEDPTTLSGTAYNENEMMAIHERAEDRTARFSVNARCAQLSYLFGDYKKAFFRTEQAKKDIESVVGIVDYAIFFYYDSLIRLASCRGRSWREKHALLKEVGLNQKKMKRWARFSPANHRHRYLAVEAQRAKLKGDRTRARDLFRESLECARRNEWTLDANILLEAFARFCFEIGEDETGEFYLWKAKNGYRSWGAFAKVSALEKTYPFLEERHEKAALESANRLETVAERPTDSFDWSTFIKASQAISSEIVLSRLLEKLMEFLVENAGARKGFVILETDGTLTIEARTDIQSGIVSVQEGLPVEESDELSQGIVQYVRRKKERVLLNSATVDGLFASDPYLVKNRPRSVLCAPILNQQHLLAILYLENDLAANTFGRERLELINLLSSQIAISLDHAQLFEKMTKAEQHLKVRNEAIRNQNEAMEFMIEKLQKTYDELNLANERTEFIRSHLQNIIDSMPSMLIGIEPELRVNLWNKEASEVVGISYEDAVGRSLSEIVPFFRDHKKDLKAAIEEKNPKKLERMLNVTVEGGEYSDVTIYPLMTAEQSGAVIRIDDITGRVQIERLMIQTEKMMSIGGLAAGMAHEINNPLNAIVLSAHNILKLLSVDLGRNIEAAEKLGSSITRVNEYAVESNIVEMLNDIMDMGGRASKIIENTLNYSRKSDSEIVPVDIRCLINESIELAAKDYDLKKNYDFRKVKIEKVYEDEVSYVPCVATEVVQVVLNLIRNAIQAMMSGQNSKEKPKLRIQLCRQGRYAKIVIEDNGPGMEAQTVERIFEPFYTTKNPGTGTGLGLSVSQYIVTENHKGKIEVDSNPGEGSRFSVYFPVESK